ncbi:MAG: helix-turn-helix domain-containing protein [Sandaracinaceae bacterium]
MPLTDDLSARLAENLKLLRGTQQKTQQQMAKLAGLPRATWANLESGGANPTLSVLHAAAAALSVSIEELLAPPRRAGQHYPRGTLPTKTRGKVLVHKLLPDPVPGMEIDRLELPFGGRMTGVPHTPGTREYLCCEAGEIELVASGERFLLAPGDLVAFRGDQKHSYANVGRGTAIGFSVVVLVSPHAVA